MEVFLEHRYFLCFRNDSQSEMTRSVFFFRHHFATYSGDFICDPVFIAGTEHTSSPYVGNSKSMQRSP